MVATEGAPRIAPVVGSGLHLHVCARAPPGQGHPYSHHPSRVDWAARPRGPAGHLQHDVRLLRDGQQLAQVGREARCQPLRPPRVRYARPHARGDVSMGSTHGEEVEQAKK